MPDVPDAGPPALDPRLTDDGGHLNPTGARIVAVAWLRFLADVVRADRAARATRNNQGDGG